jgi:glucokinase
MRTAIGIDVGGTAAKGLVITDTGEVLAEAAQASGPAGEKGWKENCRKLYSILRKSAGEDPVIGVAAPGLAAADGESIAYMPQRLPGLEGLVWREFLKVKRPVPVLNDAHAAILGERWLGAARGVQNVILLTLGTGVGGAAIVDGRLLRGQIGRAGHFGHLSLDPNGTLDITHAPGSLEDAVGDATVQRRSNGLFSCTTALTDAVRKGDGEARAIWAQSIRALAAGLCGLINAFDPEVVVIGGGISQAGPLLFRPLRRELARFEWRPGGHRARIVHARLSGWAGAFGAAWKALEHTHANAT